MGTPEVVRLRLTPAKALSLVIALLAAVLAVGLPPLVGQAHAAAGNNGSIMVNGYDLASNGNDPHISCPLVTQFSGFDANGGVHNVAVSITSQNPTGGQPVGSNVPYSPAAQTFSGASNTQTFTVDFTNFTANNKGEYHVNITVSVSTANNVETKSKTFWMTACGTQLQLSGACEQSRGNNTGNVLWTLTNPATNPTVSSIAYSADTNSGSPSGNVAGSVAPGGNTTWTTVPFTGNLTATASGGGQTLASNDAPSPTTCPIAAAGAPDMTITKSGTANAVVGDPISYTLTVTNSGNADTSGTVTVTDSVPSQITGVSATGTGWTCGTVGQDVTCTRSDVLAAGHSYPGITVSGTAGSAGNVTNTAHVSGGGETNTANNTGSQPTSITAALVKSISIAPSCNANTGIVTWTVSTTPATSGVAANVSGPSVNPASVTTGAGGTASFTSTAGNVTLTPTTAGWTGPANAVASGPCTIPANNPGPVTSPNLGLAKAVDAGNNAIVQPGQQLTYALTYSNTGNGAATGVSVTDVLPANTTFVSVADGGSYDAGTKTATWTIGNVAAGASGTVHWTVAVAQGLPAGSSVANVAMLGTTPSNTVTNPVASGDLTLGKAVDKTSTEFGDVLTYTLTAAASGAENRTGVTIIDVMPVGTTYVDGSATCSTGCPVTYDSAARKLTWAVGNINAGDSVPVTFQVTVDRPTPAADGSIPAVLIRNSGLVNSFEDPDAIPSNEVTTSITAVLGVKIIRKPPVVQPPVVQPEPVVQPATLPFTGASFPVMLFVQVGAGLAVVGVLMLLLSRRRDSGRHLA